MLLPEHFDWAGGVKADKLRNAETLPGGPAYSMARDLAAKHGIFVHAGSFMERIEGEDRIHNTSVVFNRKGEEIARYRKIHLFDVTTPDGVAYKESATVKAGDSSSPTIARASRSAARSATTCAFPACSRRSPTRAPKSSPCPPPSRMQTGKDHWEVLLRARAIETETYVCAAAQTGTFTVNNESRATYGHSLVADPWGLVVAKASDGVGIVSTRLDMAQVKRVRRLIPVAEHTRQFRRLTQNLVRTRDNYALCVRPSHE